jgi:antitoxin VapB
MRAIRDDIYHWYLPEVDVTKRAKVFWTGRSQAVRLPKEFRFSTETVSVRRDGKAIILEPLDEWPEGYWESFAGMPDEVERPAQGEHDTREALE